MIEYSLEDIVAAGERNMQWVLEEAQSRELELITVDGFDPCIEGLITTFNSEGVVAYRKSKMIEWLIMRDGMSEEDAIEHLEYNVFGAFVGDNGPVFLEGINNGNWE